MVLLNLGPVRFSLMLFDNRFGPTSLFTPPLAKPLAGPTIDALPACRHTTPVVGLVYRVTARAYYNRIFQVGQGSGGLQSSLLLLAESDLRPEQVPLCIWQLGTWASVDLAMLGKYLDLILRVFFQPKWLYDSVYLHLFRKLLQLDPDVIVRMEGRWFCPCKKAIWIHHLYFYWHISQWRSSTILIID